MTIIIPRARKNGDCSARCRFLLKLRTSLATVPIPFERCTAGLGGKNKDKNFARHEKPGPECPAGGGPSRIYLEVEFKLAPKHKARG